jgi:hypothetical protein
MDKGWLTCLMDKGWLEEEEEEVVVLLVRQDIMRHQPN